MSGEVVNWSGVVLLGEANPDLFVFPYQGECELPPPIIPFAKALYLCDGHLGFANQKTDLMGIFNSIRARAILTCKSTLSSLPN